LNVLQGIDVERQIAARRVFDSRFACRIGEDVRSGPGSVENAHHRFFKRLSVLGVDRDDLDPFRFLCRKQQCGEEEEGHDYL